MNLLQLNARQAFAQSLNKLLDRHGLPASRHGRVQAFSDLINRPVSTAHRWLSGNCIPEIDDLFLLSGIFACSLDELLGRFSTERYTFDIDQANRATYYSGNGNADINIPSAFLPFDDPTRQLGVLRVPGTEMSGYAEPNDRIFFDLTDTKIRSGAVYVLRIAGDLAIRRLRIRIDQMIDVLCENPRYPVEVINRSQIKPADDATEDDVAVLGRVIARVNFDHS